MCLNSDSLFCILFLGLYVPSHGRSTLVLSIGYPINDTSPLTSALSGSLSERQGVSRP